MPYLARFSPKLRRLSRVPSALALTFIPGEDFCCARAINSTSPLGSGSKRNEFIIMMAPADTEIRTAIIELFVNRELFMCLSEIKSEHSDGVVRRELASA